MQAIQSDHAFCRVVGICMALKLAIALVLSGTAWALTGCWTAPVASVQPKGDARLIQSAITVVAVKENATIQSIDADRRNVVLDLPEGISPPVRLGPKVTNLAQIRAGDKGRVTVAQELSVYVLKNGQLPDAEGKWGSIHANAKVLIVEPSYRLLTLEYANGHIETLKVGLNAKLQEMECGDDVVIETTELLSLRVRRP
jgi:hypothetical protein